MFKNKRISEIVQNIIILKKEKNDISLDLTMGNGNDTLFLSKTSKKVYSFDIQDLAVENTKKLLADIKNVDLILDSHENIDKYVDSLLDCAMMNLGYLPRGDKEIKTKLESTLIAVKKTINLLNENAIFTIIAYTGHAGGREEYQKLLEFLSGLNSDFAVSKIEYLNRLEDSPKILIIEK